MHDNGEYVGRSAPEIDMFEAQVRDYPNGDGWPMLIRYYSRLVARLLEGKLEQFPSLGSGRYVN